MKNMPWRRAILKVLSDASEPLHYSEIAQRILDDGLRQQTGATPAATVAATISMHLQNDVVRVDKGVYALAHSSPTPVTHGATEHAPFPSVEVQADPEDDAKDTGFLNALGMFWRREEVNWEQRGQALLGAQLKAAQPINYAEQVGVNILYSGDRVIYVVGSPSLGSDPAYGTIRVID